MQEHAVHVQHIQHQFTCKCITPVQKLSLDLFLYFSVSELFQYIFLFSQTKSGQHGHCLPATGGTTRRCADQSEFMFVNVI